MPTPQIIELPPLSSTSSSTEPTSTTQPTLRESIIRGLKGSETDIVPGEEQEDQEWKYRKSIPTMVLYDEKGLRLYDAITSDAPEYYLFQAELDLLKQHGPEMVRQMGISSSSSSSTTPDYSASGPHSDSVRNDKENERGENGDEERHQRKAEPKNSEKWGDGVVGRWNDGVNGEDGIQGKGSAECDIVELGAGSLRKTSHFLHALTDITASRSTPPITYHALDLSLPELERTLNSLEETNRQAFEGKIEVKGLWGDYERGIEFVKQGGLRKKREGVKGDETKKPVVNGSGKQQEEKPDRPTGQREKSDYFGAEGAIAASTPTDDRTRISESPAPYTPVTANSTNTASTLQDEVVTPTQLSQRRASRPLASPLLLPRNTHQLSRSQSGPRRRTSMSSLNSFSLDDGPLVELQEGEGSDGENASEKSGGEYRGPKVKGVRHAGVSLDPVGWKRDSFKEDILDMLRKLRIPLWSSSTIRTRNVHLLKVSGALTNAVFFCSFNPTDKATEATMSPMLTPRIPGLESIQPGGSDTSPPTLLIRVYGPSTGTLIARDEELRVLHTLSADYGLGPRIEGTFFNGRVEQFFPSHALTPKHLRDPETSLLIARRMRELHSVDLDALGFEERTEPTVWQRIREWVPLATKAAGLLHGIPDGDEWLKRFGLDRLSDELEKYIQWVNAQDGKGKARVFCHNDTQYGNILELEKTLPPGAPKHHQLIVIDFEYAAPNYRGYDIANHFHEWQADYHHETHAHSLTYHAPYPTVDQREQFYRAYLSVHMDSRNGDESIGDMSKVERSRIDALEHEVRLWSPASSAFWALWGIVQGEEQIEALSSGKEAQLDFDYLAYALGRIELFRKEARELGVLPAETNGSACTATESSSETGRPVHFLFLGSSLGNFDRQSAGPFLASLPLRPGTSDSLLLGLDGRPSSSDKETAIDGHLPSQMRYEEGKRKVEVAYDDPKGKTRDFILHGIDVAAEALEMEDAVEDEVGSVPKRRTSSLRRDSWSYKSRYNVKMGRHEAYYGSNEDQEVTWTEKNGRRESVTVAKGELLNIEWSLKYSMSESLELFESAGLVPAQYWQDPNSNYRLWLLRKPPFFFPNKTISPAKGSSAPLEDQRFGSVPTRSEWEALWKMWDTITLGMIPEPMLHEKPIDLRHKCLFYLGHIPTFLDIHLTRLLDGKHTEPEKFKDIFERGIDPHVEDPDECHDHSIVPEKDEDWPTLQEILQFRDRVRQRVLGLYDDIEKGARKYTRRVGRILWMTYEHEAFHAETLLYMLIQSSKTLPPPGFPQPSWDALGKQWSETKEENIVLDIEGGSVTLGHNDRESEDRAFEDDSTAWRKHEFGWDNENPEYKVRVKGYQVDSLPISNGDYWNYMQQNTVSAVPGSWLASKGVPMVKSLYGPVPMDVAQHWPLMASGEELIRYAQWKGGRLPTEPELRLLWESETGPRPAGLSANVGARRWHPVPGTNTRVDSCGRTLHGHNGGVWEWTSTKFTGYPGFETSEVYPGYSEDFFDDLHHVVLGGSYATISRLASRSSLRNFYQAKYPFAWGGGRVAYDA